MFRMVGWLLALALASAGALPAAAAAGDESRDGSGAVDCDAVEPVCEAIGGCNVTDVGRLLDDPATTVSDCV